MPREFLTLLKGTETRPPLPPEERKRKPFIEFLKRKPKFVLNPKEYQLPVDIGKGQRFARQFQLSERGLTPEEFERSVEEWRQRQIREGNMEDIKESARNAVKYGLAESEEQYITAELGDQAMQRLLELPSDLAHEVVDRYTGIPRTRTGTQGFFERTSPEDVEGAREGFLPDFGISARVTPKMEFEDLFDRRTIPTRDILPPAVSPEPIEVNEQRRIDSLKGLGFNPVPAVKTPEERERRVFDWKAYRKRGGKLAPDQWELMGMPSDIQVKLPSEESRQKILKEQSVQRAEAVGVFGEGLKNLPPLVGASVLQAIKGKDGASVVDKDWASRFIEEAQGISKEYIRETQEKYQDKGIVGTPLKYTDLAAVPQSIAFSIISMGAGLGVAVPTSFLPVPGARVAAWASGTAASGYVAFQMSSYQIMQQYLEIMNESKKTQTGKELTLEEENKLKRDFSDKAVRYGLWEAIPEAISNLGFALILTKPLTRIVGKTVATQIIGKMVLMYGEEFLTETITQKGQSAIEVEVGFREGNISWFEAFKEVAPQTFLLTTILGGIGGGAVGISNRIKKSLKEEIGTDHPMYNDLNNEISDEILAQAKLWVEGRAEEGQVIPPSVQAVQTGVSELPIKPPTGVEPAPPITPEVTPSVTPTVEGVAPPVEPPTKPPVVTELAGEELPPEFPGLMVDLQDAQTVSDIASRPDVWRKISNLPGIRNIMEVLNPSAVANTPPQKAIIIRRVLRDEAQIKSAGVIAYLGQFGSQDKMFGVVNDSGKILAGKLKGEFMNDVRTYPSKYSDRLTTEQKNWIKMANEIEEAKLQYLKDNDIPIKELTFEEGGQYAGRRVVGRLMENGEIVETGFIGAAPKRVGAKLAVEKNRVFKTQEEANEAGFKYLKEDEALGLNVQGAYNRVADKKMADWLLIQVPWRTTGASEELVLAAEAAKIKSNKAQQLLAALNRAVRGERVPDVTVKSIGQIYPEQASDLKKLIPRIQKGEPTAKDVQKLTNTAKGIIDTQKAEFQRAVSARARARERAMQVKIGEASIAAPAFAGKIFTGTEAQELAQTMRAEFDPDFSKAVGEVNKVNAISRFFMLAGDFSPFSIQLIFLMGENPKIYAGAFKGAVRAMLDPTFHNKFLAQHKATIDRHPNLILTKAGATEFTEAMARGGWLTRGELIPPKTEEAFLTTVAKMPFRVIREIGVPVLEPFQRVFEMSLDYAGIMMAEAKEHLAKTPAEIADLDQYINEFRGVTSSSRIGVSTRERQYETFILLAPRYNRAIASLLFDLSRGGIRGRQARSSLIKGIAAIVALSIALSVLKGESEDEIIDHFNPRSPNFFTWTVLGQRIGPGSKVRSVIKLIAQSTENPENLLQLSMENPALRFIRGNLAPVLGSAIDILTGRTYIGDPSRDTPADFMEEIIAKRMLPIWVENVLMEGGDITGRSVRGVAEFVGWRSYPEPLWDEVKRLRGKYAEQEFKLKYEDLNRAQAGELRRSHPDLADLEEKAKLEWTETGTEFEQWFYATREQITQERNNTLEEAASALLNELISKYQYDSERGYIRPYYSGSASVLYSAQEDLNSRDVKQIKEWVSENQKPEDKAMDEYKKHRSELIAKAELPRDWDKIETQSNAFLQKYPRNVRQYIFDHKDDWIKNLPPNARRVEEMRLSGMEDETWWDNYRGGVSKARTSTPTRVEQRFLPGERLLERESQPFTPSPSRKIGDRLIGVK